jgi:hypothetical protein
MLLCGGHWQIHLAACLHALLLLRLLRQQKALKLRMMLPLLCLCLLLHLRLPAAAAHVLLLLQQQPQGAAVLLWLGQKLWTSGQVVLLF